MDFFLWSRAAVGQLLKQEYDIKLPLRSMGKYLKRWGFTPQRPIKLAYKQNPEAVQVWLQGEYPGIEQRAKHERAKIHLGGRDSPDQQRRTWQKLRTSRPTEALMVGGTRQKLSMIAIVSNQG